MPRPSSSTNPAPPGQRLLYWLAQACKETRAEAQKSPEHVAAVVGRGAETIKRFEQAKHWPGDPDRLVAAYALIGGLADPRELYQRALDLWYEHGQMPLLGRRDDLTADQLFAQHLRPPRAPARDPLEPAGKTSAKPKKSAGS